MDLCLGFVPFLVMFLVLVFFKPLMTLFAILTGNKEVLHEAGSLCNEEIPHTDAYYTRQEMGLPPEPPRKKFKMRQWRQLEDGSWLPLPSADDPPPTGTTK